MNIVKEVKAAGAERLGREELEAVNALTRRELGEEELYLFSVRLCDNEVDRDGERFSTRTLEELAPMFVGKSGIFDHQWTAKGQTARIYKCELVREPARLTQAGDSYCWLKGYAYMLRSESNRQLIDEIDAGIKKEVSVGCSVKRKVCSICGEEVSFSPCEHRKGERYNGELCYISLEGAVDAYEFSFVAVPAQPAAGVVKGLSPDCADLKELVHRFPGCEKQLAALEEEAALGRAYLRELKDEVVRLGLLSGLEMEARDLRQMANALGAPQLERLKEAYARQAERIYPLRTQLQYGQPQADVKQGDAAFLI